MPDARAVRGWATALAAVAALAAIAVIAVPGLDRPAGPVEQRQADRPVPPSAAARVTPAAAEQAVELLLRRRAEAIRIRDEDAFMASIDPAASAQFHRDQLALFRGLAEVPLRVWSYQVDSTGTKPPPALNGADQTWAPQVYLSYAFDGVDLVPTRRALGYAFARHGGSWYLTAHAGTRASGRATWHGPWEFGVCRVLRTRSGFVLGHDGNRALAERVSRMVDGSAATVTEVWGPDWSQRVAVLLPGSKAELRAMVGPEFAVDGIAAVAVADRVDPATRRVEGPRVVLNPETADSLSDTALRVVIQHEITHIAARADTVDDAPMWMLEGFADYVGYRGSAVPPNRIAPELARQVRGEGPPDRLPSDRDFRLTGRRLDLAYQQSWSLVDFLAREYGEPRVVELYRRIAGSGTPYATDTALRELTGMTTAELTGEWQAHLSRTLGR